MSRLRPPPKWLRYERELQPQVNHVLAACHVLQRPLQRAERRVAAVQRHHDGAPAGIGSRRVS